MRVDKERRLVVFDGKGMRLTSKAKLDVGKWYHVAMTMDATRRDAARYSLYVNGARDIAAVAPYTPNAVSAVFNIGAFFRGHRVFKGAIDEVAVYRRALASQEVRRLFRWRNH